MLSTLLLVVTFLMSIFILAQYFATQEASGKDTALQAANAPDRRADQPALAREGQVADRPRTSSPRCRQRSAALKEENAQALGLRAHGRREGQGGGRQHLGSLTADLDAQKAISNEALAKVDLLNQQMLAMRRQIAALNEALEASEKKDKDSQDRIKDLGARLNAALARQVQELQRYRSDFFGRLRELLEGPQGHPRRRRPLRVRIRSAVPVGLGDADA